MATLFRKLSVEFGQSWDSRYASRDACDFAKAEWWTQIHDLTPEQLRRALDNMPVGHGAFPPGPRAFRKLALTKHDAEDPPYFQPFPERPVQTVPDAETLQRVRAMLAESMAAAEAPKRSRTALGREMTQDEHESECKRQLEALAQWAAVRGMDHV